MGKPKVGCYAITGCQGCLLSVIFNEDDLLSLLDLVDIKAFPFIADKPEEKEFDLVLFEGVVCSKDDLEELKKIRGRTKILVALGSCACTGCVPAYRNFIKDEKYRKLIFKKRELIEDLDPQPLEKHVKVDYFLPGCPPDKKQILDFLKQLLLGKKPLIQEQPVCIECKLQGNHCLLDEGKMCLGPITQGHCQAVCPTGGFECWGCRGPTEDANLERMIELLKEKGFTTKQIRERIETFEGLKIKEKEGVSKWLEL